MLDLALLGFVAMFLAFGLKRPFIWVLAYIYIDCVAPQKIGWGLIQAIPLSLIAFVAAFGGWLLFDRKQGTRFTLRQAMIAVLLRLLRLYYDHRRLPCERARQMGLGVEGAAVRDLPAADAAHPVALRGYRVDHGAGPGDDRDQRRGQDGAGRRRLRHAGAAGARERRALRGLDPVYRRGRDHPAGAVARPARHHLQARLARVDLRRRR